jgi:broad specificity phosphatase PhoE
VAAVTGVNGSLDATERELRASPSRPERMHGEEYARWERNPHTFAPAGGETGLSVTARALPTLLDIVAAHPGQTVDRRGVI